MSVLSCSRSTCQNIMCDCYVPSIGYICNDCQEEFIERWSGKIVSEDDIFEALQQFVDEEIDMKRFDFWKNLHLESFLKIILIKIWLIPKLYLPLLKQIKF